MSDMRAQRTCTYLREALLKLLDDKPLDRCTVKEVCELAQVSRKTFYAHYETLEALAQDCYLCQYVYAGPRGKRLEDYGGDLEGACRELLDQCARKLAFFQLHPNLAYAVVLGVEVSPFFETARKTEDDLNLDHLVTMYRNISVSFERPEDIAHYITDGTFGLIRRWVLSGMDADVESLAKTVAHLSFQCAAGAVEHPIEPIFAQTVRSWHFEG